MAQHKSSEWELDPVYEALLVAQEQAEQDAAADRAAQEQVAAQEAAALAAEHAASEEYEAQVPCDSPAVDAALDALLDEYVRTPVTPQPTPRKAQKHVRDLTTSTVPSTQGTARHSSTAVVTSDGGRVAVRVCGSEGRDITGYTALVWNMVYGARYGYARVSQGWVSLPGGWWNMARFMRHAGCSEQTVALPEWVG